MKKQQTMFGVPGESHLPEIDFEGTIVKPSKNGYYKCPFKCHDQRYAAPKWKTEKGFRKHMKKCPKNPAVLKKERQFLDKHYEELKAKALESCPYKLGQRIYFIRQVVTHPQYEYRYGKSVRVRTYDEGYYSAMEATITKIEVIDRRNRFMNEYPVTINGTIDVEHVYPSREEALAAAKEKTEAWETWVSNAKSCD